MSDLFDLSAEYESMLQQGLKYSGETMEYFLEGRLRRLHSLLVNDAPPQRILDFGCGIGVGSRALAALYPHSEVIGVDTAEAALVRARSVSDPRYLRYMTVDALASEALECDVCYVNGVFHHIPPAARPEALRLISKCLRPSGHFFFFENNPWNPGTQWVMSRIPFDHDAETLTIPEAKRLLRTAGFIPQRIETLFFFPRALSFLRPLESFLGPRTWLGAQYMIWGNRA